MPVGRARIPTNRDLCMFGETILVDGAKTPRAAKLKKIGARKGHGLGLKQPFGPLSSEKSKV